ncbi:50S ribosomal protein L9, chloroplastic, partial [Tanacetum coccineum]
TYLLSRLLEGFAQTTINVVAVNDNFLVAGGFQGELVCKIILIEDATDVGKKGHLLDVKAGFYMNFLHPSGKARIVTTDLIK